MEPEDNDYITSERNKREERQLSVWTVKTKRNLKAVFPNIIWCKQGRDEWPKIAKLPKGIPKKSALSGVVHMHRNQTVDTIFF